MVTLDSSGPSIELGGVDLLDYLIGRGWSCQPTPAAPLGWMCLPPGVEAGLITLPLAVIRQVTRDLLDIFDAAAHAATTGGKAMQRINVSFDLTGDFVAHTEACHALAAEHGLESTGSGAGMGMRDIDYEGTADQVEAFEEAVKQLPALEGLGVETSVSDADDQGNEGLLEGESA